MDKFIARTQAEDDGDLMLCLQEGVAYQRDMTVTQAYDAAYHQKCADKDGTEIAAKLNAGRVAMVNAHVGPNRVCDIGIGSGEFVRQRPNTYGRDVNPVAIEWLKRNDLWADSLGEFAGYTFWDVLEHLPEPGVYFRHVNLGAYVFVSIPIHDDLRRIRESKHYRPGEHVLHFTERGFVNWMYLHGFNLIESSDFETKAGRDSILSFTFRRFAWPRH